MTQDAEIARLNGVVKLLTDRLSHTSRQLVSLAHSSINPSIEMQRHLYGVVRANNKVKREILASANHHQQEQKHE